MNAPLETAAKFVQEWLWNSNKRLSVNREWDRQYILDAAQMLVDYSRDSDQLLHDIASQDGWLRTNSTRELWERLQAWKRDHPNKGLDVG